VLNENVSKSIDCCFDFIYKFQVGLLYDDDSLQAILDLTADWTPAEREMLRNKVPVTGLKTPFRDGLLKHVAEDVLKLAKVCLYEPS